jgi:hypothetical protein
MIDAVNGSKGAIEVAAGVSARDGVLVGSKEIILPTKAGMISVGTAQCKMTCQKAAVWKMLHGG